MFNFVGKKALITGATGGIGEAIARTLHQHGATVTLSGTREEKLQAVRDDLGERAFVAPCNLSDRSKVEALAGEADQLMGGLDILINNAGVTRDKVIMRLKMEDWDDVLNVNLTAAFILSKAAIRIMMKQRWGRIVSVSSIIGLMGNAGQTNYAASKAGLIGFSKSLAREVALRGITVNCIAPGFIETPMTESLNEDQRNQMCSQIPQGRIGVAKDVAAAALYLASEEAAYVTGETLNVNGGMYM